MISPWIRAKALSLTRLLERSGGLILLFLEVIGLRQPKNRVDEKAQLARSKAYHAEFRKLLTANNSFLEIIAEMEEKLHGRSFIDRFYVKRKVVRAFADIHTMVESLIFLSGGRYQGLRDRLDRIGEVLNPLMGEGEVSGPLDLVLEISSLYASHADLVGGKMANVGEIHNRLRIPTPDGFAVTTEGFRLLLEEGGIRSWIQTEHLEGVSTDRAESLSRLLQERILGLRIPERLSSEILGAYDRLAERMGSKPRVAVRSSALGEDSTLSFAGQFQTVLNVTREGLLPAYLEVIASLYSPEAVHYRLLHGIPGESSEMAVGILAMVDAVASGMAFSRDPSQPETKQVLIQAVHGLGVPLAEGRTSPEVIRVFLGEDPPRLERSPSSQRSSLMAAEGGGLVEKAFGEEEASKSCLTDEEAIRLARWAERLESHFGFPQDIEWALDSDRRLFIVQSRPLQVARRVLRAERPLPGYPLLVEGGEVACPGIGFGRAVHMDENGDMESFPEGGVLVARRSSPKFVRLLAKARAIVTDAGSTTGHMASLAREFRIPTILNTKTATRSIPEGAVVTVDANGGFVYEGEVPFPDLRESPEGEEERDTRMTILESPERRLLERVLPHISPLNLVDPRSPQFSIEGCRTLHDLSRFIHEKSYEEMFRMVERLGEGLAASYQLDVFLPIDLYIIDLGGGLKETVKGGKVKPSQIASVPLSAMIRGMLHERIPRFGSRPIDLGGLFSVMMRHAVTSPENEQTFWEPCYAMISDCYLHYTARVGYHFSVVDAYCSHQANKNYISLLFRGGAADRIRRVRRVKAIGGILRAYGFSVDTNFDTVTARLNKPNQEECVVQMEMIGRLFQFFRQMDAAMASEESVTVFQEAFLRGDYDLRDLLGKGNQRGYPTQQ